MGKLCVAKRLKVVGVARTVAVSVPPPSRLAALRRGKPGDGRPRVEKHDDSGQDEHPEDGGKAAKHGGQDLARPANGLATQDPTAEPQGKSTSAIFSVQS